MSRANPNLTGLVGPLINACIKYRENLIQHAIGSPPDALGLTCAKIDRLDLLNHDESGYIRVVHNGHMEGEIPWI
jgi:hypothetical protein